MSQFSGSSQAAIDYNSTIHRRVGIEREEFDGLAKGRASGLFDGSDPARSRPGSGSPSSWRAHFNLLAAISPQSPVSFDAEGRQNAVDLVDVRSPLPGQIFPFTIRAPRNCRTNASRTRSVATRGPIDRKSVSERIILSASSAGASLLRTASRADSTWSISLRTRSSRSSSSSMRALAF